MIKLFNICAMHYGFTPRDLMIKIIALLALLASVVGGCAQINRWAGIDDDNQIEERLEDLIEEHSGLEVDLSPESPED